MKFPNSFFFYFEWRSSRIQTSKFWGGDALAVARRNLCFCHDTSGHGGNPIYTQRNPTCRRVLKVAERWTTTGQRGTPGCCRARGRESAFGRPIRSNVIIQSFLSLSPLFLFFFLCCCYFCRWFAPYSPVRGKKGTDGRRNIKSQRGINPTRVTLFCFFLFRRRWRGRPVSSPLFPKCCVIY